MLNSSAIDQQIGQGALGTNAHHPIGSEREPIQHGAQLFDEVGHLAQAAVGRAMLEQATNALDTFTCAERLLADLPENVQGPIHHRFRPIQHAFAGLGKGRYGPKRLIELMSDPARHLGECRRAGDLHQSMQKDRGRSPLCLGIAQCHHLFRRRNPVTCPDWVLRVESLPEDGVSM